MNKAKDYLINDEYVTQGEAQKILNMYRPTLIRYTRLLGITGEKQGRCVFYRRTEIERILSIRGNIVSIATELIERETGKQVRLV